MASYLCPKGANLVTILSGKTILSETGKWFYKASLQRAASKMIQKGFPAPGLHTLHQDWFVLPIEYSSSDHMSLTGLSYKGLGFHPESLFIWGSNTAGSPHTEGLPWVNLQQQPRQISIRWHTARLLRELPSHNSRKQLPDSWPSHTVWNH